MRFSRNNNFRASWNVTREIFKPQTTPRVYMFFNIFFAMSTYFYINIFAINNCFLATICFKKIHFSFQCHFSNFAFFKLRNKFIPSVYSSTKVSFFISNKSSELYTLRRETLFLERLDTSSL
jgi:hypothetical protein